MSSTRTTRLLLVSAIRSRDWASWNTPDGRLNCPVPEPCVPRDIQTALVTSGIRTTLLLTPSVTNRVGEGVFVLLLPVLQPASAQQATITTRASMVRWKRFVFSIL